MESLKFIKMNKSKLELQSEANAEISKRKETVKALENEILHAKHTLHFIPRDTYEDNQARRVVNDEIIKLKSYIDSEQNIIRNLSGPLERDVADVASRLK